MRATPNCYSASATAFALACALALAAAARADGPAGDVKPSDTVSIMVPSADSDRPFPPWDEGRYRLQHFDVRIERESHHVGNLQALRSIYMFTARGTRVVTGLRFTYRYERGDSLAMLDQLYKATNLGEMKRVTDDELIKKLPKDRMLIVVPVGSSLMLDISPLGVAAGDKSIVETLRLAGDGTAASPRAVRVRVRNIKTSRLGPGETKNYDARVGDAIALVMDCQLVVKKIVPADEKHNMLGWVEFTPVPAAQEPALRKRAVQDEFTYAIVGTDPAFKKALADRHLRKGLLAPREMRDLIASRPDLERISGPLRLEARIRGTDLLLIWTFDAEFHGDAAGAMPKLRSSLESGTRLRETKFDADRYLADLLYRWLGIDPVSQRALAEQAAASHKFAIFGTASGDDAESATVIAPEQLPGGKGYRQHFIWAAVGRWDIELPTLRQLVEACPMLKPPPSEKPFDEFLGDKQIWSLSVSFADDSAADWSVETSGELRPELESLLAKLGFKESNHAVHVPLPNDPNGAEQFTWQRPTDASSVSLTALGNKVEISYHGPPGPK